MDRTRALKTIKSSYPEYLSEAPKMANGQPTYICPLCQNGSGEDGDGLSIDPHGNGTQFKCFKCGFYGDIIDLYQKEHNVDFKTAFTALCERFNITVDDSPAKKPVERRNAPEQTSTPPAAQNAAEGDTADTESKPDFSYYYRSVKDQITDPAAQAYLSFRGISPATAARFMLGYDKEKRFIIIPVSRSYFVARNTDTAAKMRYQNPKGASIDLFNIQALYNDAGKPVFITEGAFDALSIIEAGGEALALNSTSNTGKLIKELENRSTTNTLILCLDNDNAGRAAHLELVNGLQRLKIPFKGENISGQHKDANEALTADRDTFIETVQHTVKKITYPGLLTLDFAISAFKTTDGKYIKFPHFPAFADALKLKKHDSVVIAADTGAGKTSLMLNFMHDLQDTYPAMYFNLENDTATILQRLVAIHTGMELDRIEGYNADTHTRAAVNDAIAEITARKDIQIIEDIYSLDAIEKQIKNATRDRAEPTLVFIDTGLLVTVNNASRYERFTKISEELRRISRLNNVIVFTLLQQNREGKKEEPQQWPPKSSTLNGSLKETGSWENDATKILFLLDNPLTQAKELFITKNRAGKKGRIRLSYSPHTQTYAEAIDAAFEEEGGTLGTTGTPTGKRRR